MFILLLLTLIVSLEHSFTCVIVGRLLCNIHKDDLCVFFGRSTTLWTRDLFRLGRAFTESKCAICAKKMSASQNSNAVFWVQIFATNRTQTVCLVWRGQLCYMRCVITLLSVVPRFAFCACDPDEISLNVLYTTLCFWPIKSRLPSLWSDWTTCNPVKYLSCPLNTFSWSSKVLFSTEKFKLKAGISSGSSLNTLSCDVTCSSVYRIAMRDTNVFLCCSIFALYKLV